MIKLLFENCIGCGLCMKVCHEQSISMLNGRPVLTPEFCSTCGQCVAVCPKQALEWSGVPPVEFDRGLLPSPRQLTELFRERRTVRFFKKERISRDKIETIVAHGVYAPTNNFHLRAVIIDDPVKIDELENIVFRKISLIYRLVMKPELVFDLIRKFTPALDPKDKVKIEEALARGRTLLSRPAVVVYIVGDKRVPLSEASAQYALCNMMYFAQTLGIGSCLRGTAQIFLNRDKMARRKLQLGKKERIFGALMLGYPDIKFSNEITGKTIPVTWVNSGNKNKKEKENMKTLVIYDSEFGNTEKIAKAIEEAVGGDISVNKLGGLTRPALKNVDMLFIGSPTHGGKPTKTLQDFLNGIPAHSLEGLPAAAFDTRLSAKWLGIIGYAAGKIAKTLSAKGAVLKVGPEGFLVGGKEGPLKDGELGRAARWAKSVVASHSPVGA